MRAEKGAMPVGGCPVNRLEPRDIGGWDAQELCGLFQCPGCGLTPDHPLMLGEPPEEWAQGDGAPASPADWDIPF